MTFRHSSLDSFSTAFTPSSRNVGTLPAPPFPTPPLAPPRSPPRRSPPPRPMVPAAARPVPAAPRGPADLSDPAAAFGPGRRDRVAALVHTSGAWTRQVLAGVAEYASGRGGWDLRLEPRGFHEDPAPPPDWHGDGVICRMRSSAVRVVVERLGVPAVNVSWAGGHTAAVPQAISDEEACGRLAGRFLLDRGFGRVGFVGPPPGQDYTDAVETALRDELAAGGVGCDAYPHAPAAERLTLGEARGRFLDWLLGLPRPVALVVWTTNVGHEIVGLCLDAGLCVPDDVALLAVEFDPLVSALSPVPIAYIDQSPRQVGRRAAGVLEGMMRGGPPPDGPVLVPPRQVAERQSVDALHAADPLVRQAVAWVRRHAGEPVDVSDLARAAGLSRAMLDRRFRAALHTTPAREIRRAKLARARHLLGETELTVAEVADRCGFLHVETFVRFVKRETGRPPSAHRTH